jgi:hypothetical protein
MRSIQRSWIAVGIFVLGASSAGIAAADFTPPKDGKLTEKQVTEYIDVKKDQMDAIKAASNAASNQSSTANLAIAMHMNEKIDAAIAAHGMSKDEFNWVDGVVGKLWMIAVFQERWDDIDKPDLEKQIKDKQADRDAAKAKLDTYQKAQKDGVRVITKDQRDTAVQSATADRDSAGTDVKDIQTNIKQVNDEIAGHDKDAADDEALAKNPPADVSADDKPGYIDGKKNDAQTARDAAKEGRDRLAELQKTLDEAKAKQAAAQARIDHPEKPATDDDKAQVKQENDQAITDAKTMMDNDDQAIATLKDTIAGGSPMVKSTIGDEKPDPDNLALVQKHIKEYLAAMGLTSMLTSK